MKYNLIFILLLFSLAHNSFAQKYVVCGKISDAMSGELLYGVNVYSGAKGVSSNSYGFYSIELQSGAQSVYFSFVGYATRSIALSVRSDTTINISLNPLISQMDELVVVADGSRVNIPEISSQRKSIQEIKKITGVLGEKDVLRSIQYLPGINVANEGVNSLSIRGGAPDQNLFLLDEAVIYNPNHALSFFSAFNPDAISSVTLYKAAFPSKFGGRTSSIIDVRMREGNSKKYQVNGGVGLIASRLSIEGPIKKDTSSFILSARYSYLGAVANSLASLANQYLQHGSKFQNGNNIAFYDINAKVNHKVNSSNHIFFSSYFGNDNFFSKNFNMNYSLQWGNIGATLRWNHIFSPKLFSNSSLIFSRYHYQYEMKRDLRSFLWKADMSQIQLKSDIEYYWTEKCKINYGFFVDYLNSLPGEIVPASNETRITPFSMNRSASVVLGAYGEAEAKLFPFLNIRAGLRLTSFSELGEKTVYNYWHDSSIVTDSTFYRKGEIISSFFQPEPRLVLNFLVSRNSSVKMSYNLAFQNLHLLSNSSIGMPTDIWVPSGKHIRPQSSNQFVLGFFHDFPKQSIEFSVEGYYKINNHIFDYKENADLFLNNKIETQLLTGSANAYGVEFYVNKKSGNFSGWISYTLSKSTITINGINNGNPYPAVYDKPHNLKLVADYRSSDKWSFSSSFSFASGSNMTVPEGTFIYNGASFFLYSERNSYRVPPFHQLDISASLRPSKNRRWQGEWIFSINNVYNRKNVFSLYSMQDDHNLTEAKIFKMYLYGVLPSVSYNFSF